MTLPEAIFPKSTTVASVRMQPMSVGHALLLQRVGSPFAVGHGRIEEAGSGDVAMLVWVCSQSWRAAWRRRESLLGRAWRSWFAGRIRPAIEFYRGIAAGYVLRCWKGPAPRGPEGSTPLGAPALGILVAAMMADLGCTRSQALDTYIGEALWLVAIQAERSGVVMFDSEEGVSLMEIAKAQASLEAEAAKGVYRGS